MKIKNKLTGFIAESAPDNWSTSGQYDTKTWEEYKEPVNKDGLTMEQANDPKYWKNGKYMGVDQTLPEFSSNNKGGVYSSKNINDNIAATGSQIAKTEADVLDGIDYNTELKNLIASAKTVNDFTSSDILDIENAGRTAGDAYQTEIDKAERAKTAGMGESTISGGRMGGFMNTQITGAGAINAGVGDWAGAGGKLESIKSAYDANISDLTAKKAQAIELAKQARKEYIRTGKSTAMNAVQQALSAAQSINAQIISNQTAKANALTNAAKEAREKKTYDTTEATTSMTNMAAAGLDSSVIPQETKTKYETLLGLPSGTFDKFYEDVKTATQFAQEGRYVDFTKKITDVLQTLPAGQSITINGKEYKGLGTKTTAATSSIQEYEYYKQQEEAAGRTPMSYEAYQTADANRKVLASTIAGSSGMTPTQQTQFMNITNNFQKDSLVQAYDKGQGLVAIADQVIANPNNAANQLKSLYVLVKNLDPDSAVREGEIALANKTNSYLQQFETALTRIGKGQVISPDTAKSLAEATKELVTAWETGVNSRKSRYIAQANTVGIGQAFNDYLNSSSSFYGSDTNVGGGDGTGADMGW